MTLHFIRIEFDFHIFMLFNETGDGNLEGAFYELVERRLLWNYTYTKAPVPIPISYWDITRYQSEFPYQNYKNPPWSLERLFIAGARWPELTASGAGRVSLTRRDVNIQQSDSQTVSWRTENNEHQPAGPHSGDLSQQEVRSLHCIHSSRLPFLCEETPGVAGETAGDGRQQQPYEVICEKFSNCVENDQRVILQLGYWPVLSIRVSRSFPQQFLPAFPGGALPELLWWEFHHQLRYYKQQGVLAADQHFNLRARDSGQRFSLLWINRDRRGGNLLHLGTVVQIGSVLECCKKETRSNWFNIIDNIWQRIYVYNK